MAHTNSRYKNFLSIDVEDYFQVSAFEGIAPYSTWGKFEHRVDSNTRRILDLLSAQNTKATFFILGWVAEHYPQLIKAIAADGHEIASHGYNHERIPNISREQFKHDIVRSKALLEDLSGCQVLGFRAPSYSIQQSTLWVFDELLEAGYRYDSSIFPIAHDFYGMADWPDVPSVLEKNENGQWSPRTIENTGDFELGRHELIEIPIATLSLAGRKWPIAGGGYFRLYPYLMTRAGLNRVNKQKDAPFVFYLHPWEVDPRQPRMEGASLKSRFRHYLNLHRTEGRFERLLKDFDFAPIAESMNL